MIPASFYVEDGGLFHPTELCIGPWSRQAQHGGPPGALLGGLLERFEGHEHARVARLAIDLRRPVPMAPLRVVLGDADRGRTAERLQAHLETRDGTIVSVARALRLRRVEHAEAPTRAAPLGLGRSVAFDFFQPGTSYADALEARRVESERVIEHHVRVRVPLLEGRAMTGLERVLVIADAQSGLAPPLDPRTHTFLNPDFVAQLVRMPEGDWLRFVSRSHVGPEGLGLAESDVYDDAGFVARTSQSLVVRAR